MSSAPRSVGWPLDAPSAYQLVAAEESESDSSRHNRHANCGVREAGGVFGSDTYPTGVVVTRAQMNELSLHPHDFRASPLAKNGPLVLSRNGPPDGRIWRAPNPRDSQYGGVFKKGQGPMKPNGTIPP